MRCPRTEDAVGHMSVIPYTTTTETVNDFRYGLNLALIDPLARWGYLILVGNKEKCAFKFM
jgi:hypothetical protein